MERVSSLPESTQTRTQKTLHRSHINQIEPDHSKRTICCEVLFYSFCVSMHIVKSPEEAREDKTTIKCEMSPPSSPRSLKLDQMNFSQLTGSLEDGRGYTHTHT